MTDAFLERLDRQHIFGSLLQGPDGGIAEIALKRHPRVALGSPYLAEYMNNRIAGYEALQGLRPAAGTFNLQLTHPSCRGPLTLDRDCYQWFADRIHHGNGVHEPGIWSTLLALSSIEGVELRTLFDVGALYGYFSLTASQLIDVDALYGFEMNPDSATIAEKNFALNTSKCRTSRLVRAGVSDSTRSATPCFYKKFGLETHVTDPETTTRLEREGYRRVELDILALDDFCEANAVVPDLIKIDVEGSQFSILKGAKGILSSHRPILLIEADRPQAVNHEGVSMREMCTHLIQSLEYRLVSSNHRSWSFESTELTLDNMDAMNLDRNHLIVCLPD